MRSGATPLVSMIATTFKIASREARSTRRRLNDMRMSLGQALALASARRSSMRVSLLIRSLRSATRMKTSGATLPSIGLSHRASASKATTLSRSVSKIGWKWTEISRFEIRLAQAALEPRQFANLGLVLDREDDRLAAPAMFGVVERVVGALEQQFGRGAGLRKGGKTDRAGDLGDDAGEREESPPGVCRSERRGPESRIPPSPHRQ